jgi:hypothetical protein
MVLWSTIVFTGTVDVSLRRSKSLGSLEGRSPQRPIFDPDDGAGRTFEQDKPRIDRFVKAMKEHSSAHAYIIAYGGEVSYKDEAKIRLNCTRKYMISTHGISPSRITLIDGGYLVENAVQLLLVKPGEPKPMPSPMMNREAVRMTKAPKYPCGRGKRTLR